MMECETVYSHRGSITDVSYASGDRGMSESCLQLLLKACVQGTQNIYENYWVPLVYG